MTYQKLTLGRSPLPYIKGVLSAGNILACRLGERCNLEEGRVSAYLPETMNVSGIANYSHAHGTSRRESLEKLVRFLLGFLAENADGLLLLENRYSRKSDPNSLDCRSKVLLVGEEIYHIVTGNRASDDEIRIAIVEADASMQLVGVCSFHRRNDMWPPRSELSMPDIETIVMNASYIIVEAFDGGGFLIWESEAENRRKAEEKGMEEKGTS